MLVCHCHKCVFWELSLQQDLYPLETGSNITSYFDKSSFVTTINSMQFAWSVEEN